MPHENAYIDKIIFNNDGVSVNLPFHDAEALHDEEGVVKTINIADNSITAAKIAAGAVTKDEMADSAVTTRNVENGSITRDKIDPELAASWDSQSQGIPKINGGEVNTESDKNAFFKIAHGLGVKPKGVSVTPRTGSFDQVSLAFKPIIYSIDSVYITCRAVNTNDGAWLNGNQLSVCWIAFA